jgi:hypothetical protein
LARLGSLEFLVKIVSQVHLLSRCKAKSFGRKLEVLFLAGCRSVRKTVIGPIMAGLQILTK